MCAESAGDKSRFLFVAGLKQIRERPWNEVVLLRNDPIKYPSIFMFALMWTLEALNMRRSLCQI